MLMEIRPRSPKTGTANSSPSDRITQHIHYGLPPMPSGTLFHSVATLHMLVTLGEITATEEEQCILKVEVIMLLKRTK